MTRQHIRDGVSRTLDVMTAEVESELACESRQVAQVMHGGGRARGAASDGLNHGHAVATEGDLHASPLCTPSGGRECEGAKLEERHADASATTSRSQLSLGPAASEPVSAIVSSIAGVARIRAKLDEWSLRPLSLIQQRHSVPLAEEVAPPLDVRPHRGGDGEQRAA